MKNKFFILTAVLFSLLSLNLNSCGKKDITPVDEYVLIIEEAIQNMEKINNTTEFADYSNLVAPAEAIEFVKRHADYRLTDDDKKKLQKCYDKLITVAYEKTLAYGDLPGQYKEITKSQAQLMKDGVKNLIHNANTLGDLNGFN